MDCSRVEQAAHIVSRLVPLAKHMTGQEPIMIGVHDHRLVTLSILISILGSYAARHRVERSTRTKQVLSTYDEEFRIIQPDGSVRWVRDRAFPIRDKSRGCYRITGIAEDITELAHRIRAAEHES